MTDERADNVLHKRRAQDNSRSDSLQVNSVPPMSNSLADGHAIDGPEEEEMGRRHGSSLKGDRASIALLIGLYILQGIPLGISASIPYLLQSRKVSYKDQAVFSFVSWPFSLKLLWAPIVDSVYLASLGRRKSWLIPTQYLIAFFMLVLSGCVDDLMGGSGSTNATAAGDAGEGTTSSVRDFSVVTLTAIFFMLNFLAATQDIAVDGWALSMLSQRNVGWVSTCNTVGQTAGYFLGNVVFLALESADFCNRYLRSESQPDGVVTLPGFFRFWGVIFFISTTLVLLLKRERDHRRSSSTLDISPYDGARGALKADGSREALISGEHVDESEGQGIVSAYKQLMKIVQLPSVLMLIGILLTMKIGFAAADAVTGLKLLEEGVPKEHLAMMAVPMVPIDIVLPVIITKYMSSERPLNILLIGMPLRLLMGLLFAALVWWAPTTKVASGAYPAYFYAVILIASALHQVTIYSMFVPMMAFFAKVSDPAIGGTYMTLLNTISNLGGNWPATVSLWLIDYLTWKGCTASDDSVCTAQNSPCEAPLKPCTVLDGYYIESVVCCCIGFLWLRFMYRRVKKLQEMPATSWRCAR